MVYRTEAVEQQLVRLRSSPLFSHSRRYPIFLDYVVRKKLNGQGDELKERTVGIEAFGSSVRLRSECGPSRSRDRWRGPKAVGTVLL